MLPQKQAVVASFAQGRRHLPIRVGAKKEREPETGWAIASWRVIPRSSALVLAASDSKACFERLPIDAFARIRLRKYTLVCCGFAVPRPEHCYYCDEDCFEFTTIPGGVDVNGASLYAGRCSERRPGPPGVLDDSWPCRCEAEVGNEWHTGKGVK